MQTEIDKFLGKNGKAFTKATREALTKGKFRPLAKTTIKSRRAGSKRFGVPTTKTDSIKPLNHTGALINSIRDKQITVDLTGMEMLQYGMLQHSGWRSGGSYTNFIEGREFMPVRTTWGKKNMQVDNLSPNFRKQHELLKKIFINRITKHIRTKMTR